MSGLPASQWRRVVCQVRERIELGMAGSANGRTVGSGWAGERLVDGALGVPGMASFPGPAEDRRKILVVGLEVLRDACRAVRPAAAPSPPAPVVTAPSFAPALSVAAELTG
jgi:hypothetical protein